MAPRHIAGQLSKIPSNTIESESLAIVLTLDLASQFCFQKLSDAEGSVSVGTVGGQSLVYPSKQSPGDLAAMARKALARKLACNRNWRCLLSIITLGAPGQNLVRVALKSHSKFAKVPRQQ